MSKESDKMVCLNRARNMVDNYFDEVCPIIEGVVDPDGQELLDQDSDMSDKMVDADEAINVLYDNADPWFN